MTKRDVDSSALKKIQRAIVVDVLYAYIYIYIPLAGDHSFADHLLCSIGRGVVWLQKMVKQNPLNLDSVNIVISLIGQLDLHHPFTSPSSPILQPR